MTSARSAAEAPEATDAAPCTPATTGLRGRKRERTRRAISEAAFRLFAEEGFDAVTLTRIAAAADVAPATVFTHFASKEDIFFGRREEFDAQLWEAMGDATTGAGLVEGLRRAAFRACDLALCGEDALAQSRVFSRVLLGSPALRRSYAPFSGQRRDHLAELLVERAGPHAVEDPELREELRVFASFAIVVRDLVFDALHEALAAGEPPERVRAAVDATLTRSCDRLVRAYAGSSLLDAVLGSAAVGAE
ncbi:TetR/AcrR family transcriptional regulator [Streptomyces sp. ISL-11]|uniref:TetR/AcrR family transcriptional regulator n=1 Tax=Streptomyces sp. ISL-11 TaxID=2819174 RepID=UPI001BE8B99E|nr:TetR/AcrR family transcriptional regulator [Streptomyces sp. ISL-11]MBT2384911.1 TetR family transcriptional regulator [Streptomyces sp. ISL-11]